MLIRAKTAESSKADESSNSGLVDERRVLIP